MLDHFHLYLLTLTGLGDSKHLNLAELVQAVQTFGCDTRPSFHTEAVTKPSQLDWKVGGGDQASCI